MNIFDDDDEVLNMNFVVNRRKSIKLWLRIVKKMINSNESLEYEFKIKNINEKV